MGTMEEDICQAIKDRIVLEFSYDGEPRKVEPFILGYMGTNLVLSAFMVGGYSKSHNPDNWRHYFVEKMHRLKLTNKLGPPLRPGYNPLNSRMQPIICMVGGM